MQHPNKSFGDYQAVSSLLERSREMYFVNKKNSKIMNHYASNSFQQAKTLGLTHGYKFDAFSPDVSLSKRRLLNNIKTLIDPNSVGRQGNQHYVHV